MEMPFIAMGLLRSYTLSGIQVTPPSLSQQASSCRLMNLRRFDFLLQYFNFLILSQTQACDTFGWVLLDSEQRAKVGKVIKNIRKLNRCLLLRRDNAMQRMPLRAHSAGAVYTDYTFINWNPEMGTFQRSSVLPTRAFSESISNVNLSFCT